MDESGFERDELEQGTPAEMEELSEEDLESVSGGWTGDPGGGNNGGGGG